MQFTKQQVGMILSALSFARSEGQADIPLVKEVVEELNKYYPEVVQHYFWLLKDEIY